MANLSSRTGLTPVQTTIALANDATTTIQNFGAYDAQELIGYVSVDADTDYRAAVRVTVVKNGAGTYEVAASDVAGDDLGGNPIVTFSMSGSNLQATLPEFTPGFVSASIKYHLVSPVTNGNYPLSIDGGQILSGAISSTFLDIVGSAPLSNRNKIINGNFDVWQRGTSLSAGTGNRFLADRWRTLSTGTTVAPSRESFTLGQLAVPGEPTYFHRCVIASSAGAANYALIGQSIEGVRTFAGQTITISFWAKADSTKNIAIDIEQTFGTGGSPSPTVAGLLARKIVLSSAWQKFSITTVVPSISGKVIGTNGNDRVNLIWWLDAGSDFNARTDSLGQQSGTFDLAQIQVEIGNRATAFEHRLPSIELAACQRYYWQTTIRGRNNLNFFIPNFNGSSYVNRGKMMFPVTMRATPSFSQTRDYGDGIYSSATITANNGWDTPISTSSADLSIDANSWGAAGNAGTANFTLRFDAEY
jgi:hypothetical protein